MPCRHDKTSCASPVGGMSQHWTPAPYPKIRSKGDKSLSLSPSGLGSFMSAVSNLVKGVMKLK